MSESFTSLPYQVYKPGSDICPPVLREDTQPFVFPLQDKEKKIIETLRLQYENEANCAGLACPQIGFPYKGIIFACPDNEEAKKFRKDLVQFMGPTLWLNPSYSRHPDCQGDELVLDYEGCFSVDGVAGLVPRHYKINYTAYNVDGELIEGTAEGFLARIIQHEIDHLNGILFTDLAKEILPMEKYREMKQKIREEIEQEKLKQEQEIQQEDC